MTDNYKEKANLWDEKPWKQELATKIYNYAKENLNLSKETKLVDLGGGTGLLALKFLEDVASISVVDTSKSMLDVLRQKIEKNNLEEVNAIEQLFVDGLFERGSIDLVISSLTFHHIEDIYLQVEDIYKALSENGEILIVDLVQDSDDFHTEGQSYIHAGFEKIDIVELLEFNKFKNIKYGIIENVERMGAKGKMKNFALFVATAKK